MRARSARGAQRRWRHVRMDKDYKTIIKIEGDASGAATAAQQAATALT